MLGYVTIKKASELLNLSAATLRNWEKKGLLATRRNPFNNYRLYSIDEIESLLKKLKGGKK